LTAAGLPKGEIVPIVRLAFIVLLATGQLSCGPSIDREEAAVVRAYVDSNLKKLFDHIDFPNRPLKVIYVGGVSAGFQSGWQEFFSELGPALSSDTADSFLRRNDREYPVNAHLKFSIPHVILPEAKVKRVFEGGGGWDALYHEYPVSHGIIWFSRVGFNHEHTQALLYFSNQWQEGAGEGWLVLMQIERGTWREAARTMVWIS
jgi:hypothetical protein